MITRLRLVHEWVRFWDVRINTAWWTHVIFVYSSIVWPWLSIAITCWFYLTLVIFFKRICTLCTLVHSHRCVVQGWLDHGRFGVTEIILVTIKFGVAETWIFVAEFLLVVVSADAAIASNSTVAVRTEFVRWCQLLNSLIAFVGCCIACVVLTRRRCGHRPPKTSIIRWIKFVHFTANF